MTRRYINLCASRIAARARLDAEKDGLTGAATRTQDWTLDQLGNWTAIRARSSETYTGAYTTDRKTWVTWYNWRPYSAPP